MRRSFRYAPTPLEAVKSSFLFGSKTTAWLGTPLCNRPIDTQYCGKPCRKLVVPSSGSITQTNSASAFSAPLSSARKPCAGYASRSTPMMVSSAAWSTSETKSFLRLLRIVSRSMSEEARVMMAPALRAAFTAVLSMGCMPDFTRDRAGLGHNRADG